MGTWGLIDSDTPEDAYNRVRLLKEFFRMRTYMSILTSEIPAKLG